MILSGYYVLQRRAFRNRPFRRFAGHSNEPAPSTLSALRGLSCPFRRGPWPLPDGVVGFGLAQASLLGSEYPEAVNARTR